MKNNQYFALLDSSDQDSLVIGKVVENKDGDFILYTKQENVDWSSVFVVTPKHEDFKRYFEIGGEPENAVDLYISDGIFGFTNISKARHDALLKSKKEFNALEKQLQDKYLFGEVVGNIVRKVEDTYIFGCGSVQLTKAEMKAATDKVEKLAVKKARQDKIEDDIRKLEREQEKLDREIAQEWDNLDKALDDQLSHESIDLDQFDNVEIKNIKAILAK